MVEMEKRLNLTEEEMIQGKKPSEKKKRKPQK